MFSLERMLVNSIEASLPYVFARVLRNYTLIQNFDGNIHIEIGLHSEAERMVRPKKEASREFDSSRLKTNLMDDNLMVS